MINFYDQSYDFDKIKAILLDEELSEKEKITALLGITECEEEDLSDYMRELEDLARENQLEGAMIYYSQEIQDTTIDFPDKGVMYDSHGTYYGRCGYCGLLYSDPSDLISIYENGCLHKCCSCIERMEVNDNWEIHEVYIPDYDEEEEE